MQNFSNELHHPIFRQTSAVALALNTDAYVVGGFVRDLLLKRKSKDIDIVTSGSGIELARAVAASLKMEEKQITVFKNYGTAMFRMQDTEIEFVGARKESYAKHSRNPQVETGTLQDDQNRRDFTINTIAVSLNADSFGTLIDPFDGMSDLKKKLIRTPLKPETTFSDDPLRIMRGIRFAAQLGFSISPPTLHGMKSQAERVDIVSRERIAEELNKILLSSKPSLGLLLLDQIGVLERILPWLGKLKGVDTVDGHAHKDNFYHTLQVVDKLSQTSDNLWLIWSALLHDIGKAGTKKYIPGIGWSFHQHEIVGAKLVPRIFRELKLPLNDKMEYVKKMVFLHLRPIALVEDQVTDSAVRRLLFDAGDDIEDLMLLCEADVTSKNQIKIRQYMRNFAVVRQKLIDIEEKDRLRNFQPPIGGELIMQLFNIPPCREVGMIKNAIKEAILEGEIENRYEACYPYMLRYALSIGLKLPLASTHDAD
jgi:poly(A) polymerase